MKTYEKADGKTLELLAAVVKARHPDLEAVRFDVLKVFTDSDGPALTLGGYTALACVRILPLKQRTAGRGDAEILVDGEVFDAATEARRKAILDHELTHLAPKRDKQDRPMLDALKRPRLVMRLHDWHFGWFNSVASGQGSVASGQTPARPAECGVRNAECGIAPRWGRRDLARMAAMVAVYAVDQAAKRIEQRL
ncbi:MAG: hypothetical protein HZC54_00815 [Verrucomicrobia bacterium]|nr:hypothetical protein [Verrucomicrobiota bacterium]